ncbi:MAG TPA: hypothetical protein VM408_03630 [Methylomirabilota bacterium]|nr:hypothetical protein [Methylomirabilota bacterium]
MSRHAVPDSPVPNGDTEEQPWPSRPAAVELAGALLVVGGVVGLVGAVTGASALPVGTEPFLALTVALDLGAIALGLLVRLGRLWIVAVNYAAVLGFIDLLGAGASPLALVLGLADIVVVVILFVHKPWFDAMRRRRAERQDPAYREDWPANP